MNNKVRTGFIFGISMAILFISDSLMSGKNHTTNEIVEIISAGILAGAIGGFVVGFLLGKLKSSGFAGNSKKEDFDKENK
jgi:flagellar biosynthesis protein FliR